MYFFGIDAIIVYSFLAFTLLVGISFSGKMKTLRDYAIGDRQFNSVVLFATLSATVVGGWRIMGVSGEIYHAGIIYFIAELAATLCGYGLIVFLMVPRMDSRFKDNLSIADIMHTLYGGFSSKITSFFGIINCTVVLCIQFVALGNIMASFLNIPFKYGVLVPSMILILYSTIGGIRSVAMTDLIQFCVLIVMVPLLAKLGLDANGGIVSVFSNIPSDKYLVFDHPDFWEYAFLFFFWLLPFAHLEPAMIQRFLMLPKNRHSNGVAVSFLAILTFLLVMTLFIPFAVMIQTDGLSNNQVLGEAMRLYMPAGLKGLMVAGLVAAVMSTADSCLNTASILTTQLLGLQSKKPMLSLKIVTVVVAVIVLLAALNNFNIIRLGVFADLSVSIFVGIPLFLGICNFKISRKAYYVTCVVCGIVTIIGLSAGFSVLYLPLVCVAIALPILLYKQIFSFKYLKFAASVPQKLGFFLIIFCIALAASLFFKIPVGSLLSL